MKSNVTARCVALSVALTGLVACNGPAGPAGPTGPTGPAGTNGTNGADGSNGNNGQDGPTTGTVSVSVVQATIGDAGPTPLAGVAVTATTTEGGSVSGTGLVVSGTTDASGAVSLTLPFGVFDLSFSKAGYSSPAPIQVGLVALQSVMVSVTMGEAASSKPTLAVVATATNIGFGNTTSVTAAGASPLGETLTYKWANTSAYGVGTVSGVGTSGSITTPTLLAAAAPKADPTATGWNLGNFVSGYAVPNTFGVFPILDDTNGAVTATVTATDSSGLSTTASVTVTAGSLQNTTKSAAVGARAFFNAGVAVDGGTTWSLSAPTGSSAAFDNPSARFPSFIPDVPGTYTVTFGANSLTFYAGSWVGAISVPGSTPTPTPWAFLPDGGPASVPFAASTNCTICHGDMGIALDEFTPWIGSKHAVHMTYGMNGVPGFASGESCLSCHSVGFDLGNTNPVAGGMSQVAAAAGWTYPNTIAPGNWAAVPPAVAQLANIQCESCHGPQGNGTGGFSAAHMLTRINPGSGGPIEPFQSPRISYASEDCGTCHAAGTSHHHYSEWSTLNPDNGRGHSNLAVAQSEGLTTNCPPGSPAGSSCLNASCARCHSAQGFTEYAQNLSAGNVGSLSPTQQAAGQVNANNIQPQTCQTCHDPHQDALDPVTGEDEYQLRVWSNTGLLPGGFAVNGAGAGAICIDCHNSRNGAYNVSTTTNGTLTAYLHEDSDWIGSNPGASNTQLVSAGYPGLGSAFTNLGGPHEANQGDVFAGHNAYFLGDTTPVISPHAAVKDTCVGCHMTNNPQSYSSHGAATTATHLFAITDAEVPALCSKCHAAGTTNVDGAGIKASVVAGLGEVVTNMSNAVLARVNDASGALAPTGYGAWTDTGTLTIAKGALTDTTPGCTPATDPSCGLTNSAAVTIVTGPSTAAGYNPAISAVASPQGRSGITVLLTFTTPVAVTFSTGASSLSSFTVNLAKLEDAAANPLFAPNGNMFKANWNYTLISQDGSWGVHNPTFTFAVLSATANPWGNPNATPAQPGGLKY